MQSVAGLVRGAERPSKKQPGGQFCKENLTLSIRDFRLRGKYRGLERGAWSEFGFEKDPFRVGTDPTFA